MKRTLVYELQLATPGENGTSSTQRDRYHDESVLVYQQTRQDWHVADDPLYLGVLRHFKNGRQRPLDGLITSLQTADEAKPLIGMRLPVVNCCLPDLPLPFSTIEPDDDAIGEMAARHLASKGVRCLAIAGGYAMSFSHRRRDGFHACATRLGLPVRTIDHGNHGRSEIERAFVET